MECLDCGAKILKDGPNACDWKHDKGNCNYYFKHRIELMNKAMDKLINDNNNMYEELKQLGRRDYFA